MNLLIFKSKVKRFSGTSYSEVYYQAFSLFKSIVSKTKRRPYVRSKYFNNEKVFLDYFWQHIRQKNLNDRARRLKYYSCALDLIRNSKNEPILKENPNKRSEVLYRFSGITSSSEVFYVQIKKNKKTNEKHFISIFPSNT